MINLNLMPLDEALKIVDNEIINYTHKHAVISEHCPLFYKYIEDLKNFFELVELDKTTAADCPRIDEQFYRDIVQLLELIPGYMICYPDVDWSNYINAIITIINEYIGYQDTICKELPDQMQSDLLIDLTEKLRYVIRYIEYGASVETLLPLVMRLIERIENLDSSQPVTLQLSKMYLDALNYKGNEEQIV